jgi:hypothetical protein
LHNGGISVYLSGENAYFSGSIFTSGLLRKEIIQTVPGLVPVNGEER